jgi:hypothetical protein
MENTPNHAAQGPAPMSLRQPVTTEERERLLRCEATIERGERHLLSEGQALRQIREQRLYRADFKTFENYCRNRWDFSRQHATRLIDFADVIDDLSVTFGDKLPQRESHARALVGLTSEQRRKLWAECLEGGKKMKAADISKAAARMQMSPHNGDSVHGKSMPAKLLTPLRWYGAKKKLGGRIASIFPAHELYVELFAGSAAVLFAKEPSKNEIINDVDGDVVHLFKMMREKGKELQSLLRVTPHSRDEHQWCKDNPDSADPVERARRFGSGAANLMARSLTTVGQ